MKRTTLFTTLAIVIASCFCTYADESSPAAKPKAKGKPTELVFGNNATLTGKLEQIKTNGEDGKAVFPFYLTTDNGIIVKAADDFDPGDTGEKLEGMEVQLMEGDDSALEPFNGKRVTISGQVSTDTDLHCHAFGLFIDSIKNIEENPVGTGKAKPASPGAGAQPRKDIVEFWKVAAPKWKAGPVTKLDEEEVDGTVQTHASASRAMITEIRQAGENGYTITHKLINTTDKVLLAVHEVSWTNDPVKKLTETLYEFDSLPVQFHRRHDPSMDIVGKCSGRYMHIPAALQNAAQRRSQVFGKKSHVDTLSQTVH